jgi:OmcA/MtrC family decaheme c-type cytochrome
MNRRIHSVRGLILTATIGLFAMVLGGCSGDDGAAGAPGAPAVAPPSTATALNLQVTSATVSSPPVVNFTVTNEVGTRVVGLVSSNLYFTVAKLIPGSNGSPSKWQNYINTESSAAKGYPRGNRENSGNLVDNGDGTYTYTFKTDITDPAQTCPAATTPCKDADGNLLDLSYNASLTHRIVVQTSRPLPFSSGIYTFRPADGATSGIPTRDIVSNDKCNTCHNQLVIHGERVDTRYCVTCHNPGSTGKGQTGLVQGPQTVDFKVLVHKIHQGEELPSTLNADGAGTPGDYGIFGYSGTIASFASVVFPDMTLGSAGDTRNCIKCHDGTLNAPNATVDGDSWKNNPSRAACATCHDDVYFTASPTKPWQVTLHPGGEQADDASCASSTCHGPAAPNFSVAAVHSFPTKVKDLAAKYQIVINSVLNNVNSAPDSAPVGSSPIVNFAVVDPTNNSAKLDIKALPEFTNSNSRLALAFGYSALVNSTARKDFNNTNSGGSATRVGQPITVNLYNSSTCNNCANNAVAVGDGTYNVDLSNYLVAAAVAGPGVAASWTVPTGATGTGRAIMYGRTRHDIVPFSNKPAVGQNVPTNNAIRDVMITDTRVTGRRKVVDVAKCNNCHERLVGHGQRLDPNVCVVCHNPDATDIPRSTSPGVDGKIEESVDLKRMIHGIHAGAKKDWTGAPAHGIREQGLVVANADFSHVRYPQSQANCAACHTGTTYSLGGDWDMPTQSGILASTTTSNGQADPADDLNMSPTYAVCTSCHDSAVALLHMTTVATPLFDALQTPNIDGNIEQCSICHGPGKVADVQVVHGVK